MKQSRKSVSIALMMVLAGVGKAQPQGGGRWPVESLTVEGNHNYTTAQVLAVAGLQIGQLAAKADFEAARNRLIASGAFETVGYHFDTAPDGKGYAAGFQVLEMESAYPIRFQGLGVADSDAANVLRAHDPLFSMSHLPATQSVLDRYVRWLEEFLSSKGIHEKLEARIDPNGANRFIIVFHPARVPPSVAQVTFEGNSVIAQNVLREAIAGGGIGAPYTDEDFRRVLDTYVRPVYEARGRVRVAFLRLRTEPVSDVHGVHVFVTVDEGESYNMGKVEVEGPAPLDAATLLREGDFKTGDVADFDRVRDGLERIRKALRHAGYLDAKVTESRHIDDVKKVVDVTVHLDDGPLYTMGKLIIKGLGLDGEAEMRRMWTIAEGKPFNPDYPELFLSRIREDGVFDHLGKTSADVNLDYLKHSAQVTLTFTAGDPAKKKGGRGE